MILFGTLKVYCNEERTRTFIGLQIRTGYDSLMKLVEALDSCLVEFSLPTFYKVYMNNTCMYYQYKKIFFFRILHFT